MCKKTHFVFHEVEIKDPFGENLLVGHVDTIFQLTLKEYPGKKFWVVIDYKTSSVKRVAGPDMVSADNKAQIRAYVGILKEMGQNMLPFGFLVYIPRDNPYKFEIAVVDVSFEKERKRVKRYKQQFNAAYRHKWNLSL